MKTKTCTKCKEAKPATMLYFHADKHAKDGLYSSCRACKNAASRRSQIRNGR